MTAIARLPDGRLITEVPTEERAMCGFALGISPRELTPTAHFAGMLILRAEFRFGAGPPDENGVADMLALTGRVRTRRTIRRALRQLVAKGVIRQEGVCYRPDLGGLTRLFIEVCERDVSIDRIGRAREQ